MRELCRSRQFGKLDARFNTLVYQETTSMPDKLQIASLLYHDVTDAPQDSGFQRPAAASYRHSCKSFSRHLDEIAECPVKPTLLTSVDFSKAERHLLLTFDDGGKSALYVGDELNRRSWKGHFFIITGAICARTFLSQAEIKQLRSAGHLIGTHSHRHLDIFRAASLDTMLSEWRTSCDVLAQLLGEPCVMASLPGGNLSARVADSVRLSGIDFLFTSEPSLSPRQTGSCWILGRVCPKASDSQARIRALAGFNGWKRELIIRRLKGSVRTTFAPLYRYYVSRTTGDGLEHSLSFCSYGNRKEQKPYA
jgi:peptidoglycan/xylan/chitin deacetylase (PgdA/CDA1 family)